MALSNFRPTFSCRRGSPASRRASSERAVVDRGIAIVARGGEGVSPGAPEPLGESLQKREPIGERFSRRLSPLDPAVKRTKLRLLSVWLDAQEPPLVAREDDVQAAPPGAPPERARSAAGMAF